jgi:DNA-binding response OmpR family regulator
MHRVLIIEDNRGIAATVQEHLVAEGYQALAAATAGEGLASARAAAPDLIILDLMLPDLPGESVLLTLRAEGIASPVLILSARSDELSKVRGFRVGADDYLTKPFGILELLARVANLLRRSQGGALANRIVEFGGVAIRLATRQVTRDGVPVDLRPREYELFLALLSRPGEPWSRRELLEAVWGYDPSVESRTVDWHMSELRRKLELIPARPRYFLTVRKVGYRLSRAAE